MAKVFLDANIFIDIVERNKISLDVLMGHDLFISPLTIHILFYVAKKKVPFSKVNDIIDLLTQIPFDESITQEALQGPTKDFEDNIQLHSAAQAECDYFLTIDKNLLKLIFFGNMKVVMKLPAS